MDSEATNPQKFHIFDQELPESKFGISLLGCLLVIQKLNLKFRYTNPESFLFNKFILIDIFSNL